MTVTPYFAQDGVTLYHGDCREILQGLPDESVSAIVTDPPYGLAFMGKKWDYDVPAVEVWAECLRVLKPGGHLLAFAGTRTQHRMAVRIEDAGFEIRDMIAWVYGSGFPKSLDVSKAIDKAAGARGHDSVGFNVAGKTSGLGVIQRPELRSDHPDYIKPQGITPEAQQWQGWGTALKPALEPITVARKPLCGTVAENVLQHGTGGLNVDGCRVGT
ncbi:MAG: DNA methyltransferase, partial [Planctomyces sp.]